MSAEDWRQADLLNQETPFERTRRKALTVPCPYCHAATDERCHDRGATRLLVNLPAHHDRIQLSENPQCASSESTPASPTPESPSSNPDTTPNSHSSEPPAATPTPPPNATAECATSS